MQREAFRNLLKPAIIVVVHQALQATYSSYMTTQDVGHASDKARLHVDDHPPTLNSNRR